MLESQSDNLKDRSMTSLSARWRLMASSMLRPGADWLALEWDDQHVTAVEGRVRAGRVWMRRCLCAQWPNNLQVWEEPVEAGHWLREELDKAGITARRVVVLLPRERVALKQLQVPSASDDELPGMVLFQAGVQSAQALDEVCLDFVPRTSVKDESCRSVLLATVPRSIVESCRQVVGAASLALLSVGFSPLATTEVLLRVLGDSVSSDELVVLLNSRRPDRVEISLLCKSQWLYSCSTNLSGKDLEADSRAILAVTNRMLVATKSPDREPQIGVVWLLGSPTEDTAWAETLANHFNTPVRVASPFKAVELPRSWSMPAVQSTFSGPIGGLLIRAGAASPTIDFLVPRQRVPRRNRFRFRGLAAVALIACIAACTGFSRWHFRLRELDEQINHLAATEKDLQAQIKKGSALLKTSDLLSSWTSNNPRWLDELLALTEKMPSAEHAYLSSLQFDTHKEGSPPTLRASGYASDHDEVMRVTERLLEDRTHYELQPHSIRPSPQDQDYPVRFDFEALIQSSGSAPPRDPKSEPVVGRRE